MIWLSRVRRAIRWPLRDWALMGEAWAALLVARLAIRWRRMPWVLEQLQGLTRFRASAQESGALVRAVRRAAVLHLLPMLCLPQGLALAWMLARRGQPCELVIGAQPSNGSLDAHAWVEIGAVPVNSPADSAASFPVLLRQAVH